MDKKILIGLSLVLISSTLIIWCLLRKNEEFFNIRKTLTDHLRLFKNCPSKYLIFYIFPLFFSIGLSLIYVADKAFYSELSVILGIVLSMLLAILSILSGQDFSSVTDQIQKNKVKKVLKETTNAIVFDSILSLFLMLYGLVLIVLNNLKLTIDTSIVKCISSGIAYYIFVVILLNLLFIVKQMSKIIEFSIEVKKNK